MTSRAIRERDRQSVLASKGRCEHIRRKSMDKASAVDKRLREGAVLYPHAVILLPSVEHLDSDGNATRRPAVEGVPLRAFMQPVAAYENLTDPQTARADYVVFLPAHAPALDAFSVIVWEGRRFELYGQALVHKDPHGTLTHFYARLRVL